MKRTYIITGGTGLVGRNIVRKLLKNSDNKVILFVRDIKKASALFDNTTDIDFVNWDDNTPPSDFIKYIEGAYSIINLAGAPVAGKRWSDSYKKILYNSRINATRNIVKAIADCKIKPLSLINASAVGYYGAHGNEIIKENTPSGNDFLARLCKDWENEAEKASAYTRVAYVRTGVVLDKNDGALPKMMLPFKLFAGGPLGSGKQYIPWIHIDDIADTFIFCSEHIISGAVNGTSPSPVTNKEFSEVLGKIMQRPSFIPAPSFAIKFVMDEMSQVVLTGQRAVPDVLEKNKFNFSFTDLTKALENITAK